MPKTWSQWSGSRLLSGRLLLVLGFSLLVVLPGLVRAVDALPDLPGAPEAFTYCSTYQSGKAIANGYGAAYNPHSPGKETMLKSLCESATFRPYVDSVGIDTRNIAIYKYGYHWNGSSWVRYEYIPADGSARAAGDWLSQSARGQNDISYVGDVTYWVAYACVRVNNTWKCGCRDGSCSKSYWNIQGAQRKATSTPEEKNAPALNLSVTPTKVEYADPASPSSASVQNIQLAVKNTTSAKRTTQSGAVYTLQYRNHCTNKWETFDYPRPPASPFPASARTWAAGTQQSYPTTITKGSGAASFFAKLRYPVTMRIMINAYQGDDVRTEQAYFSNTFELVPPKCANPPANAPADLCSPMPTACPGA